MSVLSKSFISFYKELSVNNNKEWFDKNRSRYENDVKKPFQLLVKDIINEFSKSNDAFKTLTPNDCIFRINRDIRFSKDKTPYKLQASALICPGGKKTPFCLDGFYLEINVNEIRIYYGVYNPNKEQVFKIRQEIDYNLAEFQSLISDSNFLTCFGEIKGEKNKRIELEFRENAKNQMLLYNKNFYYFTILNHSLLYEDFFISELMKIHKTCSDLNNFFKRALLE